MRVVDEKALTLSGEINVHKVRASQSEIGNEFTERRAKPRINTPFPSRVWGVDVARQAFELDCTIDNVSSNGVYLRLPKTVSEGDELSVVVNFVNGADSGARALLRCQVVRTDSQADGGQGIGMAITKYHFL